jgi:uncharacterized protein (TIGR00255 family)
MILSMTGFGEAQREADGRVYHVEVRSVNNRYLKTATRLPEDFAFMEADLERLVRGRVARGSLTVRLFVRNLTAAAAYDLNAAALRSYVTQLRQVADDTGDTGLSIDLSGLAALPGVCQPPEVTEHERTQRWEIASALTNAAIDRLVEMRTVEGAELAADLNAQCAVIGTSLAAVQQRSPLVVAEYRQRLFDRIKLLLAEQAVQLTEQDLVREVAIYAERSDIHEEIARLRGHVTQFEATLKHGAAAGRKLEFIAQEMLREANTMGSKSGDAELGRLIIDIKSAIDRIKEQVQNVE